MSIGEESPDCKGQGLGCKLQRATDGGPDLHRTQILNQQNLRATETSPEFNRGSETVRKHRPEPNFVLV